MICVAALISSGTYWTIFASGCGLAALACVLIIRRFARGPWSSAAMGASALGVTLLILAYHPPETRSLPVAFAPASSASLIALSERVLADASAVGTGAGTFASVARILSRDG